MLDEMSDRDPEEYRRFLERQAKAAGVDPSKVPIPGASGSTAAGGKAAARAAPVSALDSVPPMIVTTQSRPADGAGSAAPADCMIEFYGDEEGRLGMPTAGGRAVTADTSSFEGLKVPFRLCK